MPHSHDVDTLAPPTTGASAHIDRARTHRQLGNWRAAEAEAARALELAPRNAAALAELGRAERALARPGLGWLPLAIAADLEPRDAELRTELAAALLGLGRFREAADELLDALSLAGAPDEASHLLASALYRIRLEGDADGMTARAARWKDLQPDHPVARHALAALTGANVAPRASEDWVRLTFDRFGPNFEDHLAALAYSVPARTGDLLARHLPADGSRRILDAGCGTGLCGPHLRPFARHLAGVDLSAGMLAVARDKGVYDRLVEADLIAFLNEEETPWDVVAAADVLIYLGDAEPLAAALTRALSPGGLFACSVELAEMDGWTLHPSGRYQHGVGYLERTLSAAGLRVLATEPLPVRLERGAPVPGLLVLAGLGGPGH